MRIKRCGITAAIVLTIVLAGTFLKGQTVSSTLLGTVQDPAGAVIVGADVQIADQANAQTRTMKTSTEGLFRFVDIEAGRYTLTVKAAGFKTRVQKDIEVQSSDTRDVGRVSMELGNISDQITVTAEATAIELSSSAKSREVDDTEIENMPERGRDIFGYIGTLPGVIDSSASSRNFSYSYSAGGLEMNGNLSMMNVTVDGLTGMDVGCGNCLVEGNANMDALAEVKVLSSNYEAEYGRNSGGTITLVTKSGTQQFHGTGWWTHRNEDLNANTFFNNSASVQKPKYRYNVAGWSFGGPVYIPHHWNTDKKRLFLFGSEEFTNQFPGSTLEQQNMPSALERMGNFSQSVNTNGALIVIKNPTTATAYPGNIIPPSTIGQLDPTGMGSAILNFFPLPNYSPAPGNPNFDKYNFEILNGGKHPIRNYVGRADVNITSKLTGYFRMVKMSDNTYDPFAGFPFIYSPQIFSEPSYNYSGALTYAIAPTVVNELNFGKAGSDWNYAYVDPSNLARSVFGSSQTPGGPPLLFNKTFGNPADVQSLADPAHMYDFIPNVSFGSIPSSATSVSTQRETPNPVHDYSGVDNISWVKGKHTLKGGIYLEYDWKYQPNGQGYLGSYNFGNDSANPNFGTGDGYANALLGYFDTYTEQTQRMTNIVDYWNIEWFVQDNWKVNRRLTLDLGVRFYRQTPQVDENGTWAIFNPADYNPASLPRLYVPFISNGLRVAEDPATGALAPPGAIGAYVPGTGNLADGMVALGKGVDSYHQTPPVVAAPRIGFAYDLFGDGKTALRGGFGIFYNRVNGNSVYGMTGNPPNSYNATVYDGTIQQLTQLGSGGGYIAPSSISWYSNGQWDSERNASLGIQRNVGWGTVVDASWVATWGVNQPWTYNINSIPLGADFQPQNADPTKPGSVLPSIFERTVYPGWGNLTQQAWGGSTNYNSLQTTVRHRIQHGVEISGNFTWSRSMGVTSFQPLVPNNNEYNYGPTSQDRRKILNFNYSYQLPQPGKLTHDKYLGIFLDHWVLSGITVYHSGSPFTPSFTESPTVDITGSSSLGARIQVIGNGAGAPPSPTINGLPVMFNTAAFAEPAVGTIGNAGVNILYGPSYVNFDASIARRIPLGNERRVFVLRFEGYNIFNHAEFSGLNSSATFNATGAQITNTFGTPNSTLPARICSGVLRFEF